MIYEYAIDPAVAARFENLRLIAELFDFSNPRRISRFPKSWLREVYDLSRELGDRNQKMVEVKLAQISKEKNCIQKFSREYEPHTNWPENAVNSHQLTPFRGIICDGAGAAFVASGDVDSTHPQLNFSPPFRLEKTVENFMDVLGPVLATARELCFVDPYFRPQNRNCSDLFKAIFASLNARPDASEVYLRVCTFSGESSPYGTGGEARVITDMVNNCDLGNLQHKTHVVLCEANMHARYLLTDVGAYVLDHSFSESRGAILNISMMSWERAEETKKQYFGA
ncbi:hypothetical protein [Kordiimonas sp.]|uniref:hypothetical protein n=1 Tax=Kordiimonas sp. TaxID=1970157 RepID=UPI003A90145B